MEKQSVTIERVTVEEYGAAAQNGNHNDWSEARDLFMTDFLGCRIGPDGKSDWYEFRAKGLDKDSLVSLRSCLVALGYKVLDCRAKWGWKLDSQVRTGLVRLRKTNLTAKDKREFGWVEPN